jgi:hypothetical protein
MRGLRAAFLVLVVMAASVPAARAQGLIFATAGPINSSMAVASTAAPVDVGASY